MPFTFSHPAAVIPLKALFKRLCLPALVFGSMAPDFEYFFRMKSRYSHSIGGLFFFDLPLAIMLLFLFFLIVREPLIINLPPPIRSRFVKMLNIEWLSYFKKEWFIICVSALLGSATHILWDGFTHANGYFVENSAALTSLIAGSIPLYRLLQHFSTILGIAVIAVYIYKLPKSDIPPAERRRHVYWLLSGGLFILSFLFYKFFLWGALNSLWHIVIIALSSFFSAVTLSSLIFKFRKSF
ncbi:MAG: DUF4184 family protein [Deferribacteraceae bacterium]|jgi:hypothetical protein|nr:DUF4184 family protein [Deferribacteraceae bacterium]